MCSEGAATALAFHAEERLLLGCFLVVQPVEFQPRALRHAPSSEEAAAHVRHGQSAFRRPNAQSIAHVVGQRQLK